MKIWKFLIALMFLSIGGCASTGVESLKDESFNDKLKRIHVVVIPPEKEHYYAGTADYEKKYLISALDELLTLNGITHKISLQTGLELDNDWLKKKEMEFGADSRLIITPKRITRFSNGVEWITYDAGVFIMPEKKPVWRSRSTLHLSAFAPPPEETSMVLAAELIKKMFQDKLFNGDFSEPKKKDA